MRAATGNEYGAPKLNRGRGEPVQLPDAATITKLTGYLQDQNTGPVSCVSVAPLSVAFGAVADTSIAEVGTFATSATTNAQTLTDTTISDGLVNTQTSSYTLQFCGKDSQTKLYIGSITYTPP